MRRPPANARARPADAITIAKRVAECFKRLNGGNALTIDLTSFEPPFEPESPRLRIAPLPPKGIRQECRLSGLQSVNRFGHEEAVMATHDNSLVGFGCPQCSEPLHEFLANLKSSLPFNCTFCSVEIRHLDGMLQYSAEASSPVRIVGTPFALPE